MTSILIVEDDKEMQDLLEFALSRNGYDIFLSPNGVDALHQVLQCKPDLILLDLMMPWASGDAVLGFVRSTDQLKHTRVLVVSAHPNGQALADQLDADGFLPKPIDISTLTTRIKQLLLTERHPS